MMIKTLSAFFVIGLLLSACHSELRKEWTIAVPTNNSKYESSALLLRELLAKEGIDFKMIEVASTIEATHLVAEGEADFMLSLAHSDFVISEVGDIAKNLRTVMPLFENAVFVFYRGSRTPSSIIDLAENSKIFLEVPDSLSEQNLSLRRLFGMLNVHHYEFVNDSSEATIIPIWAPSRA